MPSVENKRVTLKTIAEEIGISKSTVAQVLGRYPKSRISPSIRHRVLDVAKAKGYQPNHVARALRTGRTSLIGLVVPNVYVTTHPGFAFSIYGSILEMAGKTENAVVQLLMDPREKIKDITDRNLLDGIILLTSDPDNSYVDFLADRGLPLVVVNREVVHRGVSFVTQDYYSAACEAVDSLAETGHQNLALLAISLPNNDSNRRLVRGFQSRTKELSAQGVSGTFFGVADNLQKTYLQVAREVLESGPFDGYIVDVVELAEVLAAVLAEAGTPIGQNKDLIVFSPEEATSNLIKPWRLYLHQNELMGRQAYELLNKHVSDNMTPQRCYVPFTIVGQ